MDNENNIPFIRELISSHMFDPFEKNECIRYMQKMFSNYESIDAFSIVSTPPDSVEEEYTLDRIIRYVDKIYGSSFIYGILFNADEPPFIDLPF